MNTVSMKTMRMIGLGEISIAVGIIIFWLVFFTSGLAEFSDPRLQEICFAFESSFPAADFLLSLFLIIGGYGLLRNAAQGWFFSLMAAAMLIFLGLLDVSFNIQQGIYRLGPGEAALNLSINLVCLAGGTFLAWFVWKSAFCGLSRRPKMQSPQPAASAEGVPRNV